MMICELGLAGSWAAATLLALLGILIWYLWVRPIPVRRSRGVVVGVEAKAPRVLRRCVPRIDQGFEEVGRFERQALVGMVTYRVRLDEGGGEVRCSVPVGSVEFPLGEGVEVDYFVRGFPRGRPRLFGSRIRLADGCGENRQKSTCQNRPE